MEIDFFQFHARILKEAELPQLTELCIACTDFFQLVEQQPGSEKTAREILQERPSNLPISHKIVWGFEKDFKLVGVVEILRDYPHSGVWYVGLLLLSPELRGNGYGKKLWEAIEQQIEKMGASEVKLIVQEQNPKARKFWERMGFSFEAEVIQVLPFGENRVLRLHKLLSQLAAT